MTHINEILIPLMERLDRIEKLMNHANENESNLMAVKDIIKYCSLSEPTIRRALKRGKLKPFKKEGKKLFRKDDVDRWLKGC